MLSTLPPPSPARPHDPFGTPPVQRPMLRPPASSSVVPRASVGWAAPTFEPAAPVASRPRRWPVRLAAASLVVASVATAAVVVTRPTPRTWTGSSALWSLSAAVTHAEAEHRWDYDQVDTFADGYTSTSHGASDGDTGRTRVIEAGAGDDPDVITIHDPERHATYVSPPSALGLDAVDEAHWARFVDHLTGPVLFQPFDPLSVARVLDEAIATVDLGPDLDRGVSLHHYRVSIDARELMGDERADWFGDLFGIDLDVLDYDVWVDAGGHVHRMLLAIGGEMALRVDTTIVRVDGPGTIHIPDDDVVITVSA